MKKYKIREGSIADKAVRFGDWIDNSKIAGVLFVILMGFSFGALVAMGMNEIHPLF